MRKQYFENAKHLDHVLPSMSPPMDVTQGRTGWIISDGKAGNDVQSKGVFDALGLDVTVKLVRPRGLHKGLSPWIGVARSERFGEPGTLFAPPFPDFAISIGRLTTPYLRALKLIAGVKTFAIVLQDPKVPLKTADLFWVPEHDALRGPNVITTLTAPHSFTDRRLKVLRTTMTAEIAALPAPRFAIMLGGSNGDYTYTKAALARLSDAIRSLTASGAGLMITPSRRTEPAIIEAARAAVAAGPPHIFWDMTNENPYPQFLAHADVFVVPADSVNMTGEPCATGKPVFVFYPDGGSAKFQRYHQALEQWGATRPFSAGADVRESWAYRPLNSADIIAAEVAQRWQHREASKS